MSSPRTPQQINFSLIIFIVTASNLIFTAAGLGAFQIKIVSTKFELPSGQCHNKDKFSAIPGLCQYNSSSCKNSSLFIKACLSHHQLPVPLTLLCTLGQEATSLQDVADTRGLVISIPFSYSWPEGFVISLCAYRACHTIDPKEIMISKIVIADHILPSRKWTYFHGSSSTRSQRVAKRSTWFSRRNLRNPSQIMYTPTNTVSSLLTPKPRDLSDISGHHELISYPTMQKGHPVLDSDTKELDGLQAHVPEETSDLHTSFHAGPASAKGKSVYLLKRKRSTGYVDISNGAGESERSEQQFDHAPLQADVAAVADNNNDDDDDDGGEDVPVLSTTAVIRSQGNYIFVAVRVVCQENYYGKSCSHFCRPKDDFLGHYRCSSSGQQVCLPGWRGPECTDAVCSDKCLPSRSSCSRPFICTCRHGWRGDHCDKCSTLLGCLHGTCHLPGQCICLKGWAGPLCDVEQLFCLERQPCQNGGTCFNDRNHNYTCVCPAGYTGTHCEVPLCHHNFCLHGGLCKIAEGTRYCLCTSPYAGPRCQHRPDLTNMPHSRLQCNDPTCAVHNGSTAVLPSSLSKVPPCVSGSCNPCQDYFCYNKGTCYLHTDMTPTCNCSFPYKGPKCDQLEDPCESRPCRNGAVCQSLDVHNVSFKCVCSEGFSGNLCEFEVASSVSRTGVCDTFVTCFNGGSCRKARRGNGFYCTCPLEFTGEFCEIATLDLCSSHTCLNGGTCFPDKDGEPACNCEEGFTGVLCQHHNGSLCSRVVCQNGGTCFEHDDEFVCVCKNRFEGQFCEEKVRRKPIIQTIRVFIKATTTVSAGVKENVGFLEAICLILYSLIVNRIT